MSRSSISALFDAKDNGFSRVAARIQSRTDQLMRAASTAATRTSSVLESASKHTDKFTSGLFNMGKTAAVAGGGALVAGLTLGIKRAADFDQAMANVAAVSGATGAELDAMKKRVIDLASTTKYSGTEVAGAVENMLKAGFSMKDAGQGVGALLSAAAADGGELADISAGLMSTLKGFGAGTDQLQNFVDMMSKAGDSTAASIGSLSESMAKAGPTLKQLGVSGASSIAQLSLLEDAGLDASSAGTGLKAIYSKLAAPIGATKKELQKLGLEVADSFGNLKAPEQLFSEILAATGKLPGNVAKSAAMTNLFGLETQNAATILANAAESGRLGKLTEDLKNAAGYADEVAKKRLDSFWGDIGLLGGQIDGIINSLFDLQGRGLRGVIQETTKWIGANKGLITGELNTWIKKTKTFLREAIPVVKDFWSGLVQGAKDVKPAFDAALSAVSGVTGFIGGLFGDDATSKAQNFGRAVVWISTAIVGVSAATRVATGLKWGYNAALIAIKGTTIAYKAIVKGVPMAIDLVTKATRASAGAFGKGATAMKGAEGAMGKFAAAAGVGLIALEAWQEAWNQNEQLKKETQGLGIGDIAAGMWEQGTWNPFDVVDAHQNALAKAEAQRRAATENKAGAEGAAAAPLNDVRGGVDNALAAIEAKLSDMTAAGVTDASALSSMRSALLGVAVRVPELGTDAAETQARIEGLADSIRQLMAAAESGGPGGAPVGTPLGAPVASPRGPAAATSSSTPSVSAGQPVAATISRDQSESMARIIEAGVRRALKETPINVNVNGSTGSGSAGGTPKTPRAGVNVTDSGGM